MKKRTVILIIIGCFLAICTSYFWLSYNPIIIHKPYVQNIFLYNNLYNPIDTVDFTQGENKIIIYTNWEDLQFLPPQIKGWTLLECTNNKIIEEIKNNFVFERVSEDFVETTAFDSRIFFFKDNILVFSSKIIIDENISLHFQNTGWTFATNYNELINSFSKFKPIYFPIIKID
ncbi:hypothetical protein [Porphyromonas macacae]|uniref:hypothetical protein n=1 Tax=Porphyromonas macacae TaxID=28115 RepID=UPI0024AC8662|nr:hypothetical protein [Porphyromonas macacae]